MVVLLCFVMFCDVMVLRSNTLLFWSIAYLFYFYGIDPPVPPDFGRGK